MNQEVRKVLTDEYDTQVKITGVEPPKKLEEAVHDAFKRTIMGFSQGKTLHWKEGEGGQYILVIIGGFPEIPVITDDGGIGGWRPPYISREQFTGADGSGDGLHGNMPAGWRYELKSNSEILFFEK